MSMSRTQIYLTGEQRSQLRRLAEEQHRTMASVIREAIQEYMTRHEDALADLIGLGRSGNPRSSVDHDSVLYDEG